MKKEVLHILVAETDEWFRNKLREVFQELQYELTSITFKLTEVSDITEIKAALKKRTHDFALIEHHFFSNNTQVKQMVAIIEKQGKRCRFVMLISYGIHKNIAKVLDNINRNPTFDLVGHLLKENYPKDLIRVLLKFFMNKALS